jgi:hypothetical protein
MNTKQYGIKYCNTHTVGRLQWKTVPSVSIIAYINTLGTETNPNLKLKRGQSFPARFLIKDNPKSTLTKTSVTCSLMCSCYCIPEREVIF